MVDNLSVYYIQNQILRCQYSQIVSARGLLSVRGATLDSCCRSFKLRCTTAFNSTLAKASWKKSKSIFSTEESFSVIISLSFNGKMLPSSDKTAATAHPHWLLQQVCYVNIIIYYIVHFKKIETKVQDKNKTLLKSLYVSKISKGLRSAVKDVIIRRSSVHRTWVNCQNMSSKV